MITKLRIKEGVVEIGYVDAATGIARTFRDPRNPPHAAMGSAIAAMGDHVGRVLNVPDAAGARMALAGVAWRKWRNERTGEENTGVKIVAKFGGVLTTEQPATVALPVLWVFETRKHVPMPDELRSAIAVLEGECEAYLAAHGEATALPADNGATAASARLQADMARGLDMVEKALDAKDEAGQ
jgi:hypothetical protein